MHVTLPSDLVFQILLTILTAVVALTLPPLRAWLLKRVSANQLQLGTDIARAAAQAVEQLYRKATGVDPSVKLLQALTRAKSMADHCGINLTDDQWRSLLESAVHEINQMWSTAPAPLVPVPSTLGKTGQSAPESAPTQPAAPPTVVPAAPAALAVPSLAEQEWQRSRQAQRTIDPASRTIAPGPPPPPVGQ